MANEKYFAPSVDMAARILKYLSRYKTKQGTLSEISKALEINKSTCLRVLKTLEQHSLIFYNSETRKYSLGIYTAVLGSRVHETLDYLSYVKPFLIEASEKTRLTAAFVQRISTNRMMFVSKEDPSTRPRLTVSVGNKFPITEVSYGKWLLAYMPEEERRRFLEKGLKKITEFTITDTNLYLEQLKEIKETGVLVSREEYTPGICAISCPIFDRSKSVLGVIAVIGMSSTLTDSDLEEMKATLKDISKRCSEKFADFVVQGTPY